MMRPVRCGTLSGSTIVAEMLIRNCLPLRLLPVLSKILDPPVFVQNGDHPLAIVRNVPQPGFRRCLAEQRFAGPFVFAEQTLVHFHQQAIIAGG